VLYSYTWNYSALQGLHISVYYLREHCNGALQSFHENKWIRGCPWEEIVWNVLHTLNQLKVQHSTETWKLPGSYTSIIMRTLKWIGTEQSMQFGIYASFNGTFRMYTGLCTGITNWMEASENLIIKVATIIMKRFKYSDFHWIIQLYDLNDKPYKLHKISTVNNFWTQNPLCHISFEYSKKG
jgi:hypothetical protein